MCNCVRKKESSLVVAVHRHWVEQEEICHISFSMGGIFCSSDSLLSSMSFGRYFLGLLTSTDRHIERNIKINIYRIICEFVVVVVAICLGFVQTQCFSANRFIRLPIEIILRLIRTNYQQLDLASVDKLSISWSYKIDVFFVLFLAFIFMIQENAFPIFFPYWYNHDLTNVSVFCVLLEVCSA